MSETTNSHITGLISIIADESVMSIDVDEHHVIISYDDLIKNGLKSRDYKQGIRQLGAIIPEAIMIVNEKTGNSLKFIHHENYKHKTQLPKVVDGYVVSCIYLAHHQSDPGYATYEDFFSKELHKWRLQVILL